MKNFNDSIKYIYDYYGPEIETNKFYEEIEELRQAVRNDDRENIKEEIADVYITTVHMMNKYNISEEEIQRLIEFKIGRQKHRMLTEKIEKLKGKLTDKNKLKLRVYIENLKNNK